ncbi:MAG: hypothetical protein HKN09_10620 [Saprospiraceae bacterium]|nr:hypothetical protein [Saprospiraceae bacterium]
MSEILFEACVDNVSDAVSAIKSGAHRLELCSRLDLDGLTPNNELIQYCMAQEFPFKAMVRPREGDFSYTIEEKSRMAETIEEFIKIGIHDIVMGAIQNDKLDIDFIRQLASRFPSIKITIHKAIDHSKKLFEDIEHLKSIKQVVAILSSGGSGTAMQNRDVLKLMHQKCIPDIQLVIAGKVTQNNIPSLFAATGCTQFHGKRIMEDS